MKNCMFSIIFQNCRCVTGRIFILHHPPVIWQLYSSSNGAIPCRRLNSEMCGKLEISWIRPTWMSSISTGAHLRVLWFSVWTEAVRNHVCGNTYQRVICSAKVTEQGIEKITIVSHSIFFCLLFTWKHLFFLWSWLILKKKATVFFVFLLFCKLKYLH